MSYYFIGALTVAVPLGLLQYISWRNRQKREEDELREFREERQAAEARERDASSADAPW